MSVKLTPAQKDEIRKLTQFANRRIRKAQKEYSKHGKLILPQELAGNTRMKDDWKTAKTPLSRSVRFESERDYRQQIKFLRRFRNTAPSIYEYADRQKDMTVKAMMSTIGELSPELEDKLNKMTAPEIDTFWKNFSDKSVRLGHLYNSEAAAAAALQEIFGEDMTHLLQSSIRR